VRETVLEHTSLDHAREAAGKAAAAGTQPQRAETAAESAEDAFREFVIARWGALLRTAYLLTCDRERAEDLVQSALVRAHRHWPKIHREGRSEAYVRKTMVNLNTDWWRRLGSREHRVESVPDGRISADAYAAFDLRDELWAALQQLPNRMRAVLVLRYFEDLSDAETAAILGCSIGTVKSQCSRGLGRLRVSLGSAK
jgi:RNA polymerase sigma-70 factor (sigma-E family)